MTKPAGDRVAGEFNPAGRLTFFTVHGLPDGEDTPARGRYCR